MGKCANIAHDIKANLSTFTAPKIVEIHSWKLSVLHKTCVAAVAAYIVVYQILLSNQYMRMYPVQSVFSVELSQLRITQGQTNWFPAYWCSSSANNCRNKVKRFEELPYCCSGNCTYNIPSAPTTCTCPWKVSGLPDIRKCIYEDFLGLGNSRFPDRMVVETYRNRRVQSLNVTCQNLSGCDKPWLNNALEAYYIAGVEDYVLKLDHTLIQSDLHVSYASSQMNGALWVEGTGAIQQQLCQNPSAGVAYKEHPDVSTETTSSAPCFLLPDFTLAGQPGLLAAANITDVFYIKTLLAAAGYDLDSSGARSNGGALTISVVYANVFGLTPGSGSRQFGERAPFYVYRIEGSFNQGFRDFSVSYVDAQTRIYELSYGLSFSFNGQGEIGCFDFLTLTMVAVTGTALTGVAAVVTQLVAVSLLRHSKFYKQLLTDHGFSLEGAEELHALDDKELNSRLAKMCLAQTGKRESKILRILEAQHHVEDVEAGKAKKAEQHDADAEEALTPQELRDYLNVLDQVHGRSVSRLSVRSPPFSV